MVAQENTLKWLFGRKFSHSLIESIVVSGLFSFLGLVKDGRDPLSSSSLGNQIHLLSALVSSVNMMPSLEKCSKTRSIIDLFTETLGVKLKFLKRCNIMLK